jgi:hypothetical protein
MYQDVAIIADRPVSQFLNERGRLHNVGGPAIAYSDGFAVYSVNGVRVPELVVDRPDDITVAMVRGESNIEVRRVMIEQMGADKYLCESDAVLVHEEVDDLGHAQKLWRCVVPGDEDLVMVEVVNSTPELDGSFKTYFLRVPPSTRRVREGLAWMAQVSEDDYILAVQT